MTLEIFKAGTHRPMQGGELTFGESDVTASAEAYDPALHEAPLVVGHPEHDAPAYGWVQSLSAEGGRLLATPQQVDPAFAELVESGRFKKISASFYRPEAANNPAPGVYYLRHVGFLGAKAPSVKGLKTAAFASDESGLVTVEFAEPQAWVFRSIASLFDSLRDWLIEQEGTETADRVLSPYEVRGISETAGGMAGEMGLGRALFADGEDLPRPSAPETPPATPEETTMTKDDTPATPDAAELEKRAEALSEREKKLAEETAALRRAQAAAFVEGLIEAGKVPPGQKEGLAAFMASLDETQSLSFGEGDKATETAPADYFRGFLAALPKQIDFGEVTASGGDSQALDFGDPEQLAQAARAEAKKAAEAGEPIGIDKAMQRVLASKKD